MTTPRRRRERAFSLVELLVALAVIGLLASLLFPVFGAARRRGHETQCTSHLRQLGLAVAIYSSDFDGKRPRHFSALRQPYLTDARLLTCAADGDVDQGGWMGVLTNHLYPALGPRLEQPQSYGDFGLLESDHRWRWLQRQSGRPGYAVCLLHGTRVGQSRTPPWFEGRTLRLCFDGSVAVRQVSHRPRTFNPWQALCDQDAPPDWQ
jgi:prepilin-type N-terminal cleavage/methylation domain-containing protein